jgi:DNA helicase-2/ATP-dependent DNA helicase PcrA
VAFAERPSFTLAAEALRLLTRQDNARVYRPEVLRCCLRALQSAAAGGCTFADATVNERERNRHESRPLARRVIGSTLLLKGLEGGGSHHIPGRDGCTTPLCRYDAGIFAAGCVLANPILTAR